MTPFEEELTDALEQYYRTRLPKDHGNLMRLCREYFDDKPKILTWVDEAKEAGDE